MTQLQICSSPSANTASTAEPENLKSESENRNNESLDRCIKAWNRTYELACIDPKNDSLTPSDEDDNIFAREQGSLAFRDAMPPLAGYDNIRDFIACTTYAMLYRIFHKDECQQLLAAAKIAMALLRTQAKH
jgi:hypothetical protein